MKKLIVFLPVFFLLSFALFGQSNIRDSRAILQKIPFEGKNMVLQIECDTEIKPWLGSTIRLMLVIELEDQPVRLVKELYRLERYTLEVEDHFDEIHVTIPNLRKTVTVNNEPLKEQLFLKVMVPQWMKTEVDEKGYLVLHSNNPTKIEFLADVR